MIGVSLPMSRWLDSRTVGGRRHLLSVSAALCTPSGMSCCVTQEPLSIQNEAVCLACAQDAEAGDSWVWGLPGLFSKTKQNQSNAKQIKQWKVKQTKIAWLKKICKNFIENHKILFVFKCTHLIHTHNEKMISANQVSVLVSRLPPFILCALSHGESTWSPTPPWQMMAHSGVLPSPAQTGCLGC